jgi:tRNA pseudouridine38-40 synthase
MLLVGVIVIEFIRKRIHSFFNGPCIFPKINEELLHETAQTLFDYNDFETFSKRNSQTFTFLCTIKQSRWERHGAELHYIVEANRFLRGMVRGLVGTQLQIARGKNTVDGFRKIIEAKDCTFADFSVAGHGLYLEAVNYPEGFLRPLSLG